MSLTANKSDPRADSEDANAGRSKRRARIPGTHVSNALRSAYEEAVKEDIPASFLDLLDKLA